MPPRDIKPANLLLHAAGMSPEMPLLKVADFGLCKNTHEAPPQTRVGSPFYMAPGERPIPPHWP